MDFIKVVLISLVLLISKNCSAQPEDHTTDQNEIGKCSSDKKVCGTDGKTYSNICLLQKQTGVKLAHEGGCTSGKNGKNVTEYTPDLILKSKIVNTSEESLQKKLVKHFNPTTGKWEYEVEILPTIVITPTFHHLKTINDKQIPSSHNITKVKINADLETVDLLRLVNASTEPNGKNRPTYLGKTSDGMSLNTKFANNKFSPETFIKNKNLSEIIGNRTKNFHKFSQITRIFPNRTKNETFLSVKKPISGKPVDILPTVLPLQSLNTSKIKPPIKDVLLKNDSIGNHTNEMQSTVNRTLPEKPITEWSKSLKLPKKASKNYKQHQNPLKANINLRAPFALKPHALRHYKPYLPVHKVIPHGDSELKISDHEINNVHIVSHKNLSSPHPKTMDNITHTALNMSQPIMNNLTHTLSPKIPDHHQRLVTELSENETLPPISPVKHSAVNISQPLTNITALKYLSKDKYNPVRNISQPIKEAPKSGDHPSGKLNITRALKKPEENNGPNTHQIQPSLHPRHSKLLHSAVRVPKLHGWVPLTDMPSIIENKKENIDPTKPNIHTKPESNTKWGTYYIKLPGNVSDNIDLVINWEVLPLSTYQPNLTINVSESIGSKNFTWPKVSRYITDTSAYQKLRSGSLKPINQKIHRVVNDDVWHNTNSRHPQFLFNTRTSSDVPINVTKTTEIKTYQLEDEVGLKENRKSGLLQDWDGRKLSYVNPSLHVKPKEFGHDLEKHGSYRLDLPRNINSNFKLKFTWTLRNKLPETIRSPIDVTEKEVKYDYKWKIGGNNKEEKPIGNEEIQPIRSVNVTTHKTVTPTKHSFGERGLTGRQGPGRRLHDLAQGLGNFHLDIPKSTTKPQLNTTSAPVGTEEIRTAGSKLYPGWYYIEMLFNVPGSGGGGGCSANNNNCTNQNNYNDTGKSQMDPTDLLTFNRSVLSLLPFDHPSFLYKYAIEHAKANQVKSN